MTKLLIDEYPLIVLPTLAQIVGLEEAIILQQIHYWLGIYRKADDRKHFRDGKWWVYNTLEGWQENFPFWSVQKMRRYLKNLREKFAPNDRRRGDKIEKDTRLPREPLLLTGQYNRNGYDRTLWYTIDYEELAKLEKAFAELCPSAEHQQEHLLSPTNGDDEHQQMDLLSPTDGFVVTNTPIPETTIDQPETSTETPRDYLDDLFAHASKQKDRERGWSGATEAEYAVCQHVAALWCGGKLPTGTWGDRIEKQLAGADELLQYHDGDLAATLLTVDRFHEHYRDNGAGFTVVGPQSLGGPLRQFMADGSTKRQPGRREGHWTEAELDAARREALAETPVSLAAFFGEGEG